MNKVWVRGLGVALMILAVVGGVILLLHQMEKRRLPGWQGQLNHYVDLLNQDDGRITTVQKTVRARAPEQFLVEMSASSWSDGNYFYTTQNAGRIPPSLPLPFPPKDLWCALLVHKYTTDPALNVPNARGVVLVALHNDLYRAEWVVHTLPGQFESAETEHILSAVGCSFAE